MLVKYLLDGGVGEGCGCLGGGGGGGEDGGGGGEGGGGSLITKERVR